MKFKNYSSLFFGRSLKKFTSRKIPPANFFKSDKGFTLIEIVVIITIIAIITSLAINSLQSIIPRSRVKSIAREIASDIQNAKSEAIKKNMEILVALSPAGAGEKGSCSTCIDTDLNGKCDDGLTTILKSYTIKNNSPASVSSISGFTNGHRFRFNPRGIPVSDDGISSSSGSFKINGKNGFSISVQVTASGRITIK